MSGKDIATAALLGSILAVAATIGRAGGGFGNLAIGEKAPEFTGITDWINSKPLKLADLKGKVVVVHFWTHGCTNCIHNYPHYRAWQEQYKGNKDLLIVGIHTPEFAAEKDVPRIKEAAAKNRLSFAIAVDNDRATWKAWGNQYWPSIYVVDKAGMIRHRWDGELGDGGFRSTTQTIDKLLAE